ncbi:hypothetical protein Z517_09289 [Fonsecaea pedrosoi CBS 271.37]|uniref:Unplaced genomic scaffold supercont1.6, whole genome shotgun sequence n=1 Tax=Fonsecaea pedrosoi CBS 271.37 TaxID=1442368 RepID=A0A0D2GDV0_9EURO|nr:uncharacterized protein Z517_09289 [Fonsecaea pedrosoi CBS 271.37]KIW76845.1 hypothetical protein Z517_09289 [Fonsecaea pedrosoi CBS 271.37]
MDIEGVKPTALTYHVDQELRLIFQEFEREKLDILDGFDLKIRRTRMYLICLQAREERRELLSICTRAMTGCDPQVIIDGYFKHAESLHACNFLIPARRKDRHEQLRTEVMRGLRQLAIPLLAQRFTDRIDDFVGKHRTPQLESELRARKTRYGLDIDAAQARLAIVSRLLELWKNHEDE